MIDIPLLTSEDIEVKVKQVTKSGALALLYKTARVDRRILNEVFGVLNWTNDYKVVKDNLYCGIGIRETLTNLLFGVGIVVLKAVPIAMAMRKRVRHLTPSNVAHLQSVLVKSSILPQ